MTWGSPTVSMMLQVRSCMGDGKPWGCLLSIRIHPPAGSHFSPGRWATSIVMSQGQRKTIPKEWGCHLRREIQWITGVWLSFHGWTMLKPFHHILLVEPENTTWAWRQTLDSTLASFLHSGRVLFLFCPDNNGQVVAWSAAFADISKLGRSSIGVSVAQPQRWCRFLCLLARFDLVLGCKSPFH